MFRVLAMCWLLVTVTLAGSVQDYPDLVVADPAGAHRAGVRITYLGTNGYQLECQGSVLLVDPYLTRASLGTVSLGLPLKSDPVRVHGALARMAPKAVAILVTHGHFDHALDLPEVMRSTGARLVGSRTTVKLAEQTGAPAGKCRSIQIGERMRIGPWKVTSLEARHDCVFGVEPFTGEAKGDHPPRRAGDWKEGVPLAFLVEAGGKRIYIDSGGRPDGPLPKVGPVDLAIAGVALKDSRERLPALLKALQPRYFLPSHQDDFFRPLNRSYRFGQLTNFPEVLQQCGPRRCGPPWRLILMNYFQPWTLR